MELVLAEELNRLFAWFCGQDPLHTWMPGGMPLPCCQRCLGLYVGAALAMLLHTSLQPKLSGRFLEVHGVFLALMIPLGFHWIKQGPAIRTMSGLLFGVAVVTFVWLPFAREKSRAGIEKAWRTRAYWASVTGSALLLPLVAMQGGRSAARALGAIAFCGLLTVAMLGLANLWLGLVSGVRLLKRRPREGRGQAHLNRAASTATAPRP